MIISNSFHRNFSWLAFAFVLLLMNQAEADTWRTERRYTASPAGEPLDFVAHPQSRMVEVGKTTHLAVLPKGPVKSIQWRKNGVLLEGENEQYIEVKSKEQPDEGEPDRYDVVIQDAFGKQAVSLPATVTTSAKSTSSLTSALQMEESLKLQNLLNLVDLFRQVAFRIEEPWDGPPLSQTTLLRYEVCPNELIAEVMPPVENAELLHKAVKLEFKNCFLPKSDFMGKETGSLVSGTYIYSEKKRTSEQSENQETEIFAKNLSMRFPFSASSPGNAPIDFDIKLNGKLIQTAQTTYVGKANRRTLEEYQWTSGTRIENPQTGVGATVLSGKYSIEQFGEIRGGRYFPLRETRYFNNLKLRVGDDNVIIRGLVSRIGEDSDVQRTGKFEVWVNGKAVVQAASAASPIQKIDVQLPFSPKLNGFFLNDYKTRKTKEPENKKSPAIKPSEKANSEFKVSVAP